MKKAFLSLIFLSLFYGARSQNTGNVGIGTSTPDSTAILDLSSNSKGFLVPRLSTAQRLGITAPSNGLIVFDTTVRCPYYFDRPVSAWISLCPNSGSPGRVDTVLISTTTVQVIHDTTHVITTTSRTDTVRRMDTVLLSPTFINNTTYVIDTASHSSCHTDTIMVSAAQLAICGTNPVQIVPHPGPGKYLQITSVAARLYPGTQPYSMGGEIKFFLDPMCNSNQFFAIRGLFITGSYGLTCAGGYSNTMYLDDIEDMGYYMRADYNPWGLGNGTMKIVVTYCIIDI